MEEPQGGNATGSDSLHPPAISPANPAGEHAHTARVRTAQGKPSFLIPAAVAAGNTPPRLHEAEAATKKTAGQAAHNLTARKDEQETVAACGTAAYMSYSDSVERHAVSELLPGLLQQLGGRGALAGDAAGVAPRCNQSAGTSPIITVAHRKKRRCKAKNEMAADHTPTDCES